MSNRRRPRSDPREKLSPVATVSHVTDDLIAELGIPGLPESIPQRLEQAIQARVEAFLFHLREAAQKRYIRPLEVRLLRDAQRAVLTACELGLHDGEIYYAQFRRLVEALGYEKSDVGFRRKDDE